MIIDFEGQVALVTGATRGIGLEIARALAGANATVIVTGTDRDRADRIAGELPGGPHRGLGVDFSDQDSTTRFLERLEAEPRIDVCVNCAGINRINPIAKVEDSDWEAVQRVNLEGPLRVTRTVAGKMQAAGYGRIVNIASIFGVISKPKRALYSMSKFGLRGLTVASALDLAPFGVLVNSVSPGFVRTELTDRILSADEQAALARQVPLGRFANAEEIARVVVFLSSSANSYLTAQNIVVDGGFVNA